MVFKNICFVGEYRRTRQQKAPVGTLAQFRISSLPRVCFAWEKYQTASTALILAGAV